MSALAPILQERDGSWGGWTGVADFAPDPFDHDGIEQRPVALSGEDLRTARVTPRTYPSELPVTREVIEAFRGSIGGTQRAANLAWVQSLSDEELDRAGIHEERGEESVRRIVKLLAAHDIVHCRQIERIKAVL